MPESASSMCPLKRFTDRGKLRRCAGERSHWFKTLKTRLVTAFKHSNLVFLSVGKYEWLRHSFARFPTNQNPAQRLSGRARSRYRRPFRFVDRTGVAISKASQSMLSELYRRVRNVRPASAIRIPPRPLQPCGAKSPLLTMRFASSGSSKTSHYGRFHFNIRFRFLYSSAF